MRPTLYLAGLQARRHHGPGRKLCAMALPRWFERGDGRCHDAAPAVQDLIEVQRSGDLARYRVACEDRWANYLAAVRLHALPADGPGWGLTYCLPGTEDHAPVEDGDTLFCSCAAPGSPRWKHPCHLEILAPYLVRAGWDVVLWGRRLTLRIERATTTREGAVVRPERRTVVWAGTPDRYDPAAYGWPNTEAPP